MSDYLLKDICERELESGCYNYSIGGINVYNYLKRKYRQALLKEQGLSTGVRNWDVKSVFLAARTTFISFAHLIRIVFSKDKICCLIHAFSRLDSVKGTFVDKFTDPIIDYSSVGDSYVIFQRGWNHPKPRIHNHKVIYSDAIYVMAKVWSLLWMPFFYLNNKTILNELSSTLNNAFPSVYYNNKIKVQTILYSLNVTNLYRFFLRRLQVNNILAPSRADFLCIIPAAKIEHVQILELQHGVTYDETVTYSGFRDPFFTPDWFLSFGDMQRNDVYGIDEKNIINVGWAFNDYVKSLDSKAIERGVLVVSEPSHNEQLFNSMLVLAKEYPDVHFFFRPHPLEHISKEQRIIIESFSNLSVDDNSCNIWVSLSRFNHVIGVDSTVLYEALSLNKNVGKVFMNGLIPKYLQEEDERLFDVINGVSSFYSFINKTKPERTKSIYSSFNRLMIDNLLINNNNDYNA